MVQLPVGPIEPQVSRLLIALLLVDVVHIPGADIHIQCRNIGRPQEGHGGAACPAAPGDLHGVGLVQLKALAGQAVFNALSLYGHLLAPGQAEFRSVQPGIGGQEEIVSAVFLLPTGDLL